MGSNNIYWLKKRRKLERKSKLDREYKNSILIVCEGEKTEPNYFKAFPVSGVKVEILGKGKNTKSLVNDAVAEWKKNAEEGKYFEKLWCVFDKDDFLQANYNQAFETVKSEEIRLNKKYKKKKGRKITIRIAYSNEAFELWYLLHYDYHTSGISRARYSGMLSHRMKRKYRKNDPDMYNFLLELSNKSSSCQGQEFAIQNAQKLRKVINGKQPYNHNPSTSVDLLVLELNNYLKK
ncbi:MAG: RloB family protein [Candidatus Cloacimonadota bacterium]|nr:RloB family protein [Candidatus Cloacimonadota bacterium]